MRRFLGPFLKYNESFPYLRFLNVLEVTNLTIKRERVEKVSTVELFAVCLHHGDSVVTSFKDLHLVHRLQSAPCKVSLPGDEDSILHSLNRYFLIQICVLKETWQIPVDKLCLSSQLNFNLNLSKSCHGLYPLNKPTKLSLAIYWFPVV